MWTQGTFERHSAWVGETDTLRLVLLPELGSKLISLQDKASGREWLSRSGKPLGNPGYGSSFSDGDSSGWDEMFPGINRCVCEAEPYTGVEVPDHGEVWALPWYCSLQGDRLHCEVQGVRFPYRLEKTYRFVEPRTVRIDYKVTNLSDRPLPFLWAAHPLFRIREGMRMEVDDDQASITVSYSKDGRLGEFGSVRSWPLATTMGGRMLDLRQIPGRDAGGAEKFYLSERVAKGTVRLIDPATGERLEMNVPPERVPYLAIWANYGGYEDGYHLAIEPATGFLDDLDYAIRCGKTAVVEPNHTYDWWLDVSLRKPFTGVTGVR